tara:strand:- start:153 stop:548 length:396 start_codon:yes stop_codon:yes gene_type:complete
MLKLLNSIRRNKMETIEVRHTAFQGTEDTVALVEVKENLSLVQKLEYAFRWTNNTSGSWSKKVISIEHEGVDYPNRDYNEFVTVVTPLYKDEDGQEYGHRSTSVGDQLVINDQVYVVANVGFENLKGERVQ